MERNTIDDLDIQALVDSQLGWEEEKSVWNAIEADPRLHKRYQELTDLKKTLLMWWAEENDDAKKSLPRSHEAALQH